MILKCNSVILSVLFVTAQMQVSAQPSSGTAASDEVLITLHAEDAFLPGILSILAKESGYNIVTDPKVNQQDKISIHLDNVPIEQANIMPYDWHV